MKSSEIIPAIWVISFLIMIITILVFIWTFALIWLKVALTAAVILWISSIINDID